MVLHAMLTHPMVANAVGTAQEIEARGFLRGVGKLILIIIVVLVILGVVLGVSLSRFVNRRR
jgi:phosphotransferase system  glucose/maltose/N-acetylglucosamine-specific IIC component